MRPITNPLNLKKALHLEPLYGLNSAAFFNVLLIAFFLTLLSSRFIFTPGTSIALPKAKGGELATGYVVTIAGPNTLFYDGKIYSMQTIARLLPQLHTQNPQPLLLKVDKNIDMQTFLDLCNHARSAGFDTVQIASDPK
ncbi:MAG: hypothetical protein A2Y14_02880 [Verrucomicrobia bacterium GWF2_51_19]|nr:MAG: hypothetical protein A2Y14_02880 [Verrucomicrobia bacterium GWF2_51_19]